MSKFTTCHKCKEEFFYNEEHECKVSVEEIPLEALIQRFITITDMRGTPTEIVNRLKSQAATIKELEGENEELDYQNIIKEQQIQFCIGAVKNYSHEIDTKDQEIERLKGALEKYGLHHQCPKWKGSTIKCTCGLDEALNPTKEKNDN